MMEEIWWKRIPNAERLVQDVVCSLGKGQHVLLQYQRHLPWPSTFQQVLETAIQHHDGERRLRVVKAEEIGTGTDSLGIYLLAHFCKPELRAEFRPGVGYAKFLAQRCETSTLKDCYLIIEGGTAEQVNQWLSFLSEYSRQLGRERGILCLMISPVMGTDSWHGVTTLCYEKYLTEYDSYIFFMLVADAQTIPQKLKPYLGEFVIALAGTDIEFGLACLTYGCDFLADTWRILESVREMGSYSDGRRMNDIPEEKDVQSAWWMTQVKLLFPKIEAFRQSFLERHRKEIEAFLPYPNSEGEIIEDYHEVELGLLWHMRNSGSLQLVVHSEEDEDLQRYRMLRNRLAHVKPLSLQEINKYAL